MAYLVICNGVKILSNLPEEIYLELRMTDPDFITKAEGISKCLGLFVFPNDLHYLIDKVVARNINGSLISPLYYDHYYDVFMTSISVLTFEEADLFVSVDEVRKRCKTPRIFESNKITSDRNLGGKKVLSRYIERSWDNVVSYDHLTIDILHRSIALQDVKYLPGGREGVTAINPCKERGMLQTFKGLTDA